MIEKSFILISYILKVKYAFIFYFYRISFYLSLLYLGFFNKFYMKYVILL